MKRLLLILIAILLISGCVEKECRTDSDCSGRDCFELECKNNKCVYSPIANCCGNDKCESNENYENCSDDCPNCNDDNNCTKDSYDYHKQECVNTAILNVICCGNKICEQGEDYENCASDCPDCNDKNDCTVDSYDYHKQECVNEIITPCCGNEICDENAETYLNCAEDCPVCNDNNKMTSDIFNYKTQKCEYVVTHYFIDDFEQDTKDWAISGEGNWSKIVENGNTVLKLGHNQANLLGEWDNYAFKFRFKIIMGSIHANFRHSHTKEGWNRYFVGVSGNGMHGLSKQIGNDFQKLKDASSSKLDDEWHTLEIRCYDNIINVYFDDTLLIKYKDTEEPFLSGKAGIEIHTGGEDITPEFLIDDVEVKVISRGDVKAP